MFCLIEDAFPLNFRVWSPKFRLFLKSFETLSWFSQRLSCGDILTDNASETETVNFHTSTPCCLHRKGFLIKSFCYSRLELLMSFALRLSVVLCPSPYIPCLMSPYSLLARDSYGCWQLRVLHIVLNECNECKRLLAATQRVANGKRQSEASKNGG